MAFTRGVAANIVVTALDKVLYNAFDGERIEGYTHASDPVVFHQETVDRRTVVSEQFKGAGYFQVRGDEQDVVQGTAEVANQLTTTILNYSKALDIPKTFLLFMLSFLLWFH